MSSFERICAEVITRITPSLQERKRVLKLASELRQKVKGAVKELGIVTEVEIEGSVAKDTWLNYMPDIDIFIRVKTNVPRKAFGTILLRAAKKATQGFQQIERFAEHPYLECITKNLRINIVPCYDVKQGEWISATDRTPFHTSYIKDHLDRGSKNEVRLLKQFMQGINTYGAEIKVGGFSGYLCELIILHNKTFIKTLKSAANWRRKVIDNEGHYPGGEAIKIFKDPLIVIDPIDKNRNTAAAVGEDKLNEFIAASRAFMRNPNLNFFFPIEVEALNSKKIIQAIRARGSAIIFLKFGKVKAVPDILWGQLYKSQKSLRSLIQRSGFKVTRDKVWSNEKNINIFIFEVEGRFLPLIKRHLGPPIYKREDCEQFLRKHLNSERIISGPRIEGNRWIAEIKREHTDVVELLIEKLKGGSGVGLTKLLAKSISDSFEILVNEEILKLYSSNKEFAKFLTKYLKGRPKWL